MANLSASEYGESMQDEYAQADGMPENPERHEADREGESHATTRRRALFIPARITNVRTYAPGEVRKISLMLPDSVEIDGRSVPVHDRMRPGAAFLVKPFGSRTRKHRRRMYTRSNCAVDSPRVLETIINDTHAGKADTSPWWQTEEPARLWRTGEALDVRVDYDETESALVVYQHSDTEERHNLILEPDREWPSMRIVAVALATGITPFLSHVRYMKASAFGIPSGTQGTHDAHAQGGRFSLIVSVSDPRRLMEHQALLDLAAEYPQRFSYHPVLTREWPEDWPWTRGRIIRVRSPERAGVDGAEETVRVNLAPLLALEPDLHQCHLRFCGNAMARDQLVAGLAQARLTPLSFRSEAW